MGALLAIIAVTAMLHALSGNILWQARRSSLSWLDALNVF